MATLDIPAGGLSLQGWPRQPYKYSSKESTIKRTAVLLRMNKQAIQELKQCSNNGDKVRLLSGRNPSLQFGSKSIALQVGPESYTHELYTRDEESGDKLSYTATITQRASLSVPRKDTAGTDAALANLKQSLASFAQDKEAKQATISSTVIPGTKKVLSSKLFPQTPRNASQAHTPSGRSPATTSIPAADSTAAAQTKAMTFALSHLLSSRPTSEEHIARHTHIPRSRLPALLQKIADQDRKTQEWQLRDRAFKDLDVWKFKYPNEEDREAAIDGAIRAFDRMRLSKDDKVWQQLLPQKERGKGKCLSRLHNNIHLAATKGPAHFGASSPLITPDVDSSLTGRLTPSASTPMSRSGSGTGKNSFIEKRIKQRAAEEAKAVKAKKDSSPESKGSAKASTRFKSSEVVHSSDDSSGEMGLITGKQKRALSAARSNDARSPPSASSSSEGLPLKATLAKKATAGKLQKSPDKPSAATPPHRPVNGKDTPTPEGKRLPSVLGKSADQRPRASSGASQGRAALAADTKGAKTPNGTPGGLFGGHEKPKQVLRKVVAGKTSPKTDSPAPAAAPKKTTSPAGKAHGSTPNIFGTYNVPPQVVKKVVASIGSNGTKAVVSTGTPNSNKRPADSTIEADRPRKAAKPNPQPTTTKGGAPLKRKAEEMSPAASHEPSKHRRTESTSTLSVGAYSSSSGNSHTTTARTSVASPSPQLHDSWMGRSPSATPTSENGKVSWERALLDAERFRSTLFPRYKALYDKIEATREEEVRREEREELWRMHVELKELKRVFRSVASA